jgi:transcription elongation GreA/GreB family factor
VAFRRDCDEEHLEPKFELPLPPGANLVTRRGLEQIRTRVRELEQQIGSQGDVASEEAKRDLRYWKTREATAQIGPEPAGDQVAFGTRVRIRLGGTERVIFIVGHDEADPANGYLSASAPLVRALLGGTVGELLPFAGKEDAAEILGIEVLA